MRGLRLLIVALLVAAEPAFADPIDAAVSTVFGAFGLVVLAVLLGASIGKRRTLPKGVGQNALLVVRVWAVVLIAQVAFVALTEMLHASEQIIEGFARFLLPVICGAIATRLALRP